MLCFHNERGAVMIVVLAILLMLGLIGTAMINTSTQDMNISDNFKRNSQAFYAAESGLELTRYQLWTNYVNTAIASPPKAAGDAGSYSTYSQWLNSIGLPDSTSTVLVTNQSVSHQGKVDSVRVERRDMPAGMGTDLLVKSYGSDAIRSAEQVTEVLRISAGVFSGFDFAILAKNINCIMCHARVDNAKRFFNTDLTMQDTFDRVKVASLENLMLRTGSADSYVGGTLYTRGIVTDNKGVPIVDLSPSRKGLEAWQIDNAGHILEPLNAVKMTNTTGSPLPTNGNLYLNYPSDPALMTDGPLPTSFPSAIPDANNNRVVDASEFNDVASMSGGSLQGGIIYGVPTGGAYNGSSLPATGNVPSVNGTYDGNLILVGTDANPINISSQLAVNGDVIIKGKVIGDGQIFAKGNIYVAGDVTYQDGSAGGNRTFGYATGGSSNALSLAAGGNIMVGDYLTTSGGILDTLSNDKGDGTTAFSFTMSEVTLFNRGEWSKTQALLPGAGGGLVANPEYDATYTPRYYTLGPGDPVYIYNKNPGNKGTYYDPATRSWKGKEHVDKYDLTMLTQINQGSPLLTNVAQLNLAPQSSWVSETQLKKFWINDENARPAGAAFQFDGQLYTNNSIFSLTRSTSKTAGAMQINGSIVAADIGILVPGGLRVNYDSRLRSKLKVPNNTSIALYRVSWLSQSGNY